MSEDEITLESLEAIDAAVVLSWQWKYHVLSATIHDSVSDALEWLRDMELDGTGSTHGLEVIAVGGESTIVLRDGPDGRYTDQWRRIESAWRDREPEDEWLSADDDQQVTWWVRIGGLTQSKHSKSVDVWGGYEPDGKAKAEALAAKIGPRATVVRKGGT
jgi:hypothetical protein